MQINYYNTSITLLKKMVRLEKLILIYWMIDRSMTLWNQDCVEYSMYVGI